MSQQLKPSPAAEQTMDIAGYRPISGLAVASLALAIVYSLVILVLGGLAVYYGDALPLGTWSLLFPVAAAVLAHLARREIRRSEGTRSGLAIANWGWWLSIGFGLGYGAIYAGTYLALTWQAQTYAQRFFDELRAGKVVHAFLRTQAPDVQKSADPNNQEQATIRFGSLLKTFKGKELVRLLQQSGNDAVISDLGVGGWEYDKGYHITQGYRVTTPEGSFDVRLSLRSSEDRKARGWWIAVGESDLTAPTVSLTPYGEALRKWRQDSQFFTFIWMQKRTTALMDLLGTTVGMDSVYLDTLEPRDRNIWKSYVATAFLSDMAIPAGVLGLAGQGSFATHLAPACSREWRYHCYYPGYTAFALGALVKTDKLNASGKIRDEIMREAANLFNHRSRANLKQTEGNTGTPEPFDAKTQRLRVIHNIDLDSADQGAASPDATKFHAEGQLIVESDSGEFTVTRQPQWRVVSLILLTGGEPPAADPRNPREDGPGAPPRTRQIKAITVETK